MNRLTRFAVRLYPKAWRERYGVEFAALLDELRAPLLRSLVGGQAYRQQHPESAGSLNDETSN